MNISLFDLFSIGIGPSSSHTVGPMYAALHYVDLLKHADTLTRCHKITVELYGSLALTGKGHGTDKAIINGLAGYDPATVDPASMVPRLHQVIANHTLHLGAIKEIAFEYATDLVFHQKEFLPKHSNGMRFSAYDETQQLLSQQVYYSLGGGFISTDEEFGLDISDAITLPYTFSTAAQLLTHCHQHQLNISEVMLANERVWRSTADIHQGILNIANIMEQCIKNGCQASGELPGGLHVKRRAPGLYQKLELRQGIPSLFEVADIMNRLNLYAIAVNEENAAGGRVVTAPTNGAAGIIPAVMNYYKHSHKNSSSAGIIEYFLTAAAIGILYKKGASISGAEVGCQGEVGVASSMAAAGLTAALGGSVEQVENAAEIAMEHHLGMTCDPIGGLVQIPCIERNAMGAVKAVNAARMALIGDGQHKVSLDKVIKTMKQTGADMNRIYKETSQGGLAVNIAEC